MSSRDDDELWDQPPSPLDEPVTWLGVWSRRLGDIWDGLDLLALGLCILGALVVAWRYFTS